MASILKQHQKEVRVVQNSQQVQEDCKIFGNKCKQIQSLVEHYK